MSDTGTGIDPAILPRVTEPFFTTKASGKGTGLGLAMAKGFAEQSSGLLEIKSCLEQGTTVSLLLLQVAHRPAAEDLLLMSNQGEPKPSSPRLILVDDDPFVLETFTELLSERYTVRPASSGAEALALLDSGQPADVLVTDLKMPGIDGLQLIQPAQSRRAGLHAILLTGYAGDIASSAVSDAVLGSFSLLRKPVSRTELSERIDALMAITRH